MTDLINDIGDVPAKDMQLLYEQYAPLFEFIRDKRTIPYLVIIIDKGIKYVKEKYSDQELDWKAWSIVYLKNRYFSHKIKKLKDIFDNIDVFMEYHKKEYSEYVSNSISVTDFDRDYGFVCMLLKK